MEFNRNNLQKQSIEETDLWLPTITSPWHLEITSVDNIISEPLITHVTVHHMSPVDNKGFIMIHSRPIMKIRLQNTDENVVGISAPLINGKTTEVVTLQ